MRFIPRKYIVLFSSSAPFCRTGIFFCKKKEISSRQTKLLLSKIIHTLFGLNLHFWWDQKFLLKLADKKLKAGSTLSKTLFFSDGNEDSSSPGSPFHTAVLAFDSLLKKRNIKGLDFEYMPYPTESHMTVPIKSYYDGLRFIYHQW